MPRVMIDTGSARTIVRSEDLNISGAPDAGAEGVRRIRGVGGFEFVLTERVDQLRVGDLTVGPFAVQIGALDYGLGISAILGFDFLTRAGAVIELANLDLRPAVSP